MSMADENKKSGINLYHQSHQQVMYWELTSAPSRNRNLQPPA